MKARFPLCAFFCVLLGAASLCPAAAPFPGSNPEGHGPVYAQGTVKVFDSMDAVHAYVAAALPYCPPSLRLELGEVLMENKDAEKLQREYERCAVSGVRCTEARLQNNQLVLRFAYEERVRIMSLYRRFVNADEKAWMYEGPLYMDEMGIEDESVLRDRNERKKRHSKRNYELEKRLTRPGYTPPKIPCPEFDNLRDACCYIISAMPYCPEYLCLDFPEELGVSEYMELEKAANTAYRGLAERINFILPDLKSEIPRKLSQRYPYIGSEEVLWRGRDIVVCQGNQEKKNVVTLRMNHDLGARYLAVYQKKISEDLLEKEEKKSYEVLREMVDEVMELHSMEYHRAVALHDAMLRRFNMVAPQEQSIKKHYDHSNRFLQYIDKEVKLCFSEYSRLYSLLCAMAGLEGLHVHGKLCHPDTIRHLATPVMTTVLPHLDWKQTDHGGNCCNPKDAMESGRKGFPMEHSWNMLYLDGVWTHVDVFSDDLVPPNSKTLHHGFFGLTDKQLYEEANDRIPDPQWKHRHLCAVLYDYNRHWPADEYPQAEDESLHYGEKFKRSFPTLAEMLVEGGELRMKSEHPIMLEARVEAFEKMAPSPKRPHALFRKIRSAVGSNMPFDFTEDGKVSLLFE